MLKYKLHQIKRMKQDHIETATKACQGTVLEGFCKMRQAAQATGIDVTMAARGCFQIQKAIHDCDCRSSRRQKGRRTQLPRNMKKIGTVCSPKIDTR